MQAVLLYVLVEHDHVVEDRHHQSLGKDRRFPRGSTCSQAVEPVKFRNTPILLGACGFDGQYCTSQREGRSERAPISRHHLCLFKAPFWGKRSADL
jgi:hypothetical protein